MLKSDENSLEIIHFNLMSLKSLNALIYQDLYNLSKSSPNSFTLFIGFQPNSQDFRILEEVTETSTETSTETTTETTVISAPATDSPLRIQQYTMTGYLFSLLALFIVLIGGLTLCSVQAPEKFPRLPLLVGRESN